MSKDIKLKYKNILGFGYMVFSYDINTYLIIRTKNKIKIIFYKWYEFSSPNRKNEIIESLEKEGYVDLTECYNSNEEKIIENVKRLVLENPIDMSSERPNRC